MNKLIGILMALLFIAACSQTTPSKRPSSVDSAKTQKYLNELKELEKELNKNFPSTLVLPKKKGEINILQQLSFKYCQADFKTYVEWRGTKEFDRGLLWRDQFNLSTERPSKKIFRYRGAWAINLGEKSLLRARSKIFFNSKEERNETYKKIKRIRSICKKRYIKKALANLQKDKEGQIDDNLKYIGMIPIRGEDMEGEFRSGGEVAILEAEQSFLERVRAIRNAKKNIFYQSLIYTGDEAGKFLTNELIKRRLEGLDVRVIVDGVFSHVLDAPTEKVYGKNTRIMYNNMMASGIRVYGYSCGMKHIRSEIFGADVLKFLRRNHEKYLIADSFLDPSAPTRRVVMGGINTANEYFAAYGKKKESFRDQDVLLRGDVVQDIARGFLSTWEDKRYRYKAYRYDHKCFNPYDPVKEKKKFQAFRKKNLRKYKKYKSRKSLALEAKVKRNLKAFISSLEGNPKTLNDPTLMGKWTIEKPKFFPMEGSRFILMRPEEGEHFILPAYIDLINKAEKSIMISSAFLIMVPEMREALWNASARGVRVLVQSNSAEAAHVPIHSIVGRTKHYDLVYPELKEFPKAKKYLESGNLIEVYDWMGKRKGSNNFDRGTMHSKYMVIDGTTGLVGSYNLTASSEKNAESTIIFESKNGGGQRLEKIFLNDLKWSKKLNKTQLLDYKKPRKLKDRFQKRIFGLLEKFL